MAMHEVEGEPNAETAIELIDRRGHWGHYRLLPVTGQKHQLRAHLNALGIPILHDQIYPELQPALPPEVAPDFSRPLQLLARTLAFTDPVTGQERAFESPRRLSLDIIDTLAD
jgi:tRNA pseudouridine32 synthase/23S rRNA pseudouridine746 synthase